MLDELCVYTAPRELLNATESPSITSAPSITVEPSVSPNPTPSPLTVPTYTPTPLDFNFTWTNTCIDAQDYSCVSVLSLFIFVSLHLMNFCIFVFFLVC
jgi:hypothetical protein